MTQNEILSGNRLIAEFMGGTVTPIDTCVNYTHMSIPHWAFVESDFDTLKVGGYGYAKSWDWLMPVVEKISKIPLIGATDISDTCYPRTFGMINVETGNVMVRFNATYLCEAPTLIEAVFFAVVEFVRSENRIKSEIEDDKMKCLGHDLYTSMESDKLISKEDFEKEWEKNVE